MAKVFANSGRLASSRNSIFSRRRRQSSRVSRLQAEAPVITQIRHRGLLLCAELDAGVSADTMMEIEARLFERGFIVSVKPRERVIRTYCPLVITNEMIDRYLSALGNVLRELEAHIAY